MPLDSRIAMMGQVPDIAGAIQGGMDWHDKRQAASVERDKQRRLSDLLPQAAHGDQAAIDQLWAVDPNVAMRMDDRQKAHAQAVVGDVSNAVRWADTPEKWQYVQQHYGSQGVDLSGYGFADRERGLVALGQVGDYLKSAPEMKVYPTVPGGGLYGVNTQTGDFKAFVQPNEGGHQMGDPVSSGGIPQGAADMLRSNPSLAPQFDEKYGQGAAQKVLGGQSGYAPAGGFR